MAGHFRTMLLQSLILTLILTVGVLARAYRLNVGPPEPAESEHIMTVAEAADSVEELVCVRHNRTLFHELSGICVRFMGNGDGSVAIGYYRLVPLTASALTLFLVLGLGLHRRGGLMGTPDAVLWGTALLAVAPGLAASAWFFTPDSLQILFFGGLLLTMRSYAQWPGSVSAALFGVLAVLLAAVTPDALWTLIVLVPAIFIGVGWRRICLYWRTWHAVLTLGCAGALFFVLWRVGVASLPEVPRVPTAFLRELADRIVVDGLCGLAFVAWGWVAVWAFLGTDRRFARVIALLFLFSFWASFFFEGGGPFAVQLAVLSPLVLAVALSTLPSVILRWAVGHLVLAMVTAMLLCTVVKQIGADHDRNLPLLRAAESSLDERTSADEPY